MIMKKYLFLGIVSVITGAYMLYTVTTMQPYAYVPQNIQLTANMLTIGSAVMFAVGFLLLWLVVIQNRWKKE